MTLFDIKSQSSINSVSYKFGKCFQFINAQSGFWLKCLFYFITCDYIFQLENAYIKFLITCFFCILS
ncbi:hypothetical protein ACE6H2_018878 [Prunus campanulata]